MGTERVNGYIQVSTGK